MSCTEMYMVRQDGTVHEVAEFKNAFRGAWMVWSQMGERYLKVDVMGEGYLKVDVAILMSRGADKMQSVWDLWMGEDVLLAHRIVMASTFDKVMVKRENLPRLVAAIEEYAKCFDPGTLLEQAQKLRELHSEGDIQAVCWNATSVSCSPWWVYDDPEDDEDEGRPYSVNRDEGHWYLFEKFEENVE